MTARILRSATPLALLVGTIIVATIIVASAAPPKAESGTWSIQVEPITAEEGQLPPDFSSATYEYLITDLVKLKKFEKVYRSGDRRAESVPNLLILRSTLTNFERGNQTKRAVTTVAGATKVAVRLKITTRESTPILERDVQGTVRIFGENLKATENLAKSITDVLREAQFPADAKKASK